MAATTGVPARERTKPGVIGLWIVVAIAALIWALPIIFMLFTSLKTRDAIFDTPAFLPPTEFAWANYAEALGRGNLLNSAKNSAIIALIKVPLGLLVASMAAFALARLKVPLGRVILMLLVLGTMVPIQVALAPLFRIVLGLGLLNTYPGIILPYLAFGIPYQIFILYGFLRAIPRELDEAARIDGTTNWQLYWNIILPLARPALAALFILDFVATWNEFAIALVVLQSQDAWTVPLALQGFNTQFSSSYGPLTAAIMLSILPVLAVYLMFQRYFVEGTFSGAVKG
jgi:raffinose/stachyose/melibiose transport system permease protein